MAKFFRGFFNIFRFHKAKMLFFVACVLVFLVILFPYSDLGDLVSSQVAKISGNQIFLQFEEPGLSLFPALGIKLTNVHLETSFFPPLRAKSISISPSLSGLLSFKPAVSLHASQLLGGDVDLSIKKISVSGKPGQALNLDAEKLELGDLLKLGSYNIPVTGSLTLSSSAELDSTYGEQPKGDVQMNIRNFALQPEAVATPLGPLTLPALNLSNIQLKGDLRDGKFIIDQMTLGQNGDEMAAQIKGQVDVRVSDMGGQPQMVPGAYNLEVRLATQNSFQGKAGLFLSFLNAYKVAGNPLNYAFRISAPSVNSPPKMTPL